METHPKPVVQMVARGWLGWLGWLAALGGGFNEYLVVTSIAVDYNWS